jgi:HK97 family phage prohead protease
MTIGMLTLAVKALDGDSPTGDFEAILSVEVKDREGETVKAGALNPLPANIPIFYNHDWRSGALPVGKATPFYDGDVLKAKGTYASTPKGQEMRALVAEGIVDSMSVGFLKKAAARGGVVTKGELIEASFTGIPILPSARVLAAKALDSIDPAPGFDPTLKTMDGSYEDLTEDLAEALRAMFGQWVCIRGTFADHVVYDLWNGDTGTTTTWSVPYTASPDSDDTFTFGDPVEVDVEEVIVASDSKSVSADDPAAVRPAAQAADVTAAGSSADEDGRNQLLARSLERLAAI